MSQLQSSHKLGIAGLVVVAVLVFMYCRQKHEEMTSTMPMMKASDMPDMAVVANPSPSGGGLMPADLNDVDFAPYPGATKACAVAQPFAA